MKDSVQEEIIEMSVNILETFVRSLVDETLR